MTEVVHDEKLLMHVFQNSLSGATLSWYIRLDNIKINKWKHLVDAFVKQYKYNMDIAPNRTNKFNLEKRDKESIRKYAQRWRDLAAQVHLSSFGQRNGYFICQHAQGTVLQACDW
jgi:hypothetical protein